MQKVGKASVIAIIIAFTFGILCKDTYSRKFSTHQKGSPIVLETREGVATYILIKELQKGTEKFIIDGKDFTIRELGKSNVEVLWSDDDLIIIFRNESSLKGRLIVDGVFSGDIEKRVLIKNKWHEKISKIWPLSVAYHTDIDSDFQIDVG